MNRRPSSGTRAAVREHHRVTADIAADCQVEGHEPFVGIVRDVSLGGAFIQAAPRPAFGSKVTVTLHLSTGASLGFSGLVRWVSDCGFGMQFGLLGARDTHALVKLLAELRDRQADALARGEDVPITDRASGTD